MNTKKVDGKLTLTKLQQMKPRTIIASGVASNDQRGLWMTNDFPGRDLRWVAVRGGIEDWAIYAYWAKEHGIEITRDQVMKQGEKVSRRDDIRRLVPCTEEAFKMYRY